MTANNPLSKFIDDERSVAPVIGFLLIFAILIVAFSSYQATVVPNQNAGIEFSHSQEAQDEMTKVRSAIIEARTSGEPRSTTFKLGVDYPNRQLALNPPPATGRLETGTRRNISIEYQNSPDALNFTNYSGVNEGDVYTRFLTYTPSYNEYSGGASIRHEHGVVYNDFSNTPEGSGTVILNENQQLVRTSEEGTNRLTVVPIQGDYVEDGVRRVSIDPEPGILQTREFDDTNVTVPTKLTESQWEDLLEGELPAENVVVDETAEELTLVLDGTWAVAYAPVGVSGTPESGARGDADNEINPASPGDIRLIGSERLQNTKEWTVTFKNTGETSTSFTEGRISFYVAQNDVPTLQDIYDPTQNNAGTRTSFPWQVGDDFAPLDPAITLEAGQQTQLTFDFEDVKSNDEFFVVSLILQSGEQATYFVGQNPSTGGGDGGGNGGTSATFESVEATVTSESNAPGNPGIDQIRFDWQLSESTEIQLRILDGNGVEIGTTTVNPADIDASDTVDTNDREPRPVAVEAEIISTGETCSATIGDGDGDGPFAMSCT